jgi:hypothetical protein
MELLGIPGDYHPHPSLLHQGGEERGGYAEGSLIYLSADRLYLFNPKNFKKYLKVAPARPIRISRGEAKAQTGQKGGSQEAEPTGNLP